MRHALWCNYLRKSAQGQREFFLNLGFFHSLALYGSYSFQASERTLLLQYFAQLEQHRIIANHTKQTNMGDRFLFLQNA